ncbi:MAG: hypothetical protein IT305_01920 [Chloroflexi bacterium]|nr:hypothetical protein [Chloroflexota bacterium]
MSLNENVAELEAWAAAGVDGLNIEPGAPWVESLVEWSTLFDRFTAAVLRHGPRRPWPVCLSPD